MLVSSFHRYQVCFLLMFVKLGAGLRVDRRQDSNVAFNSSSISTESSSTSSSSSPSSTTSSSSASSTLELTVIQEVTANVIPVELKISSTSSVAALANRPLDNVDSDARKASTTTSSESSSDASQSTSDNKDRTSTSQPSSSTSGSTTSTSAGRVKTPTSSDLATITTAPEPNWHDWAIFPWGNHPQWNGYPWGNSTIPINTCWHDGYPGKDDSPWWPGCHVNAWEVIVSYFPKQKGNLTYPTTQYVPDLGITMSSPSIYLILKTIEATNGCGRLGPTYANRVVEMAPESVSTLQLYDNVSAQSMIGEPRMLDVDDIATGCDHAAFIGSTLTTGKDWTKRPMASDSFNRCSPRISWPPQIKSLGYKYWEHCMISNEEYGLFDPPGAVPPITGGLLPSPLPPAPAPIPSTVPAAPAPSIPPPVVVPTPTPTPSLAPTPDPSPAPSVADPPPPPVQNTPQPPVATQEPPNTTPVPPTPVLPPQPSSVEVVTTVNNDPNSGQPQPPNVVLPNGSTASLGVQVTLSSGFDKPVVVSVGPTAIFVESDNVVNTANVNPPGPGIVTPTPVPNNPPDTINPVAIATVAGATISAAPAASTILFQSQTLELGGPAITMEGTNVVATFGSQGLVVQSAGGAVSSYTLPVAGPAVTGSIIGTVHGSALTVAASGSLVIVGTEALVLNGPRVTLSSNEVLSLGSDGVVVQVPGGGVETFTLPKVGSTTSSSTSSAGPGVLIANIIGASTAAAMTASSTSTTPSSVAQTVDNLVQPTNGAAHTENTLIFVTGVIVHSTSVIAQQSLTNTSISLSSNTTVASPSISRSVIIGVPVTRSSSTTPLSIAPPSTSSTPPPKTAAPGNGNILGIPPTSAASTYLLSCKSIMALFAGISVCILSNSCT